MILLALITPEKPPDAPEAVRRFLEEKSSRIPTVCDVPCLKGLFGGGAVQTLKKWLGVMLITPPESANLQDW